MIIIIRGAPGVGKTTVSRILVEKLENYALIHGDDVFPKMSETTRNQFIARHIPHRRSFMGKLLAANIALMVEFGLNIIVDYYFPNDFDLPELLQRIEPLGQDIHIFILSADPEEHFRRDEARPEDWRIGKKGVEHFRENKEYVRVPIGNMLDTTALTPEETASKILLRINNQSGEIDAGH